jgi:simple sugar transport system ATP-binding protein
VTAGPGSGAVGAGALLEMRGVRKAFGPVVALDGAHLDVREGEIHGLLGGNGAGKTTLMNVLYGLYRADAGEVVLGGRPVQIRSPRDALGYGIGMVHQHFLQVDPFTVTQNVTLGLPSRGAGPAAAGVEERLRDLAARFGLEVDPRARVGDLPVGTRQRVEILKALYRRVRVLILDEPTTNLTPQEVDSLFGSLRAVVREGISVVFITHKIREARSVCDRISVMRWGRTVATFSRDDASDDALVQAMVGMEVDVAASLLFGGAPVQRIAPSDQVALRVEGLEVRVAGVPVVRDCTLEVRRGEILGVAGVAGNGQGELVEAVMGVRPRARGRLWVDGEDVSQATTGQLWARGVTCIPEDRLRDGFLPPATVVDNLILGFHRRAPYRRGPWLDGTAAVEAARRLITEYRIKTSGPHSPAATLSGGNIQRLMLARAFSHPCRVLVAHNPTRGLDVPSTEFVYARLLDLRRQGAGIVLVSEDLDELLLLADRIAVIFRGQIVGTLDRERFDRYRIGRLMSGVESSG